MVTERILKQLEQGIIPWHKPWTGTAGAWSRSTGRAYSLLNQWLMPQGEYATFNQIKKEGGKVKAGSHGYPLVFFKPQVIEVEDKQTGEKVKRTVPILKYYTVFNIAEQVEGLEPKHHKEDVENHNEPLEELEAIKAGYLDRSGVKLDHVRGDKACYSPTSDSIILRVLIATLWFLVLNSFLFAQSTLSMINFMPTSMIPSNPISAPMRIFLLHRLLSLLISGFTSSISTSQ